MTGPKAPAPPRQLMMTFELHEAPRHVHHGATGQGDGLGEPAGRGRGAGRQR